MVALKLTTPLNVLLGGSQLTAEHRRSTSHLINNSYTVQLLTFTDW